MLSNYSLLCLIGITACFFISGTVSLEAIVGGYIVHDVDEFPYQASLLLFDGTFLNCGAGIIDKQYVITAAHCTLALDGHLRDTRISILVGTVNRNVKNDPPASMIRVSQIYVPVEFQPTNQHSHADIAVLKLADPLEFSSRTHLKKLNLPPNSNANYAGETALIAGFGWDWYNATTKQGGHSDNKLRYAEAVVLRECDAAYQYETRRRKGVMGEHLCAQIPQNNYFKRGLCHVDSGGPLVYDGTVIAVVSIGIAGCSEKHAGALYTPVSHYLKFVERAMNYERNKYHWDIHEYHLH